MAFVDELKLHLRAGKGGDGVVRWRHDKFRELGGPSGGDGGKGGDVHSYAVRDIGVLARYRHLKELGAEDGENGGSVGRKGKDGRRLVLEVPVGSVITNLKSGKRVELLQEGKEELLLKGGRGGYGNEHFKASRNVRPTQWTPGREGDEADFSVELELIADASIVGLPNAGKSSLLNALTHAQARVGDYPFTTLEPNLGELFGFIIADIPGLIEGAADGKGLGHKFLRHIKRTRVILHCISVEHPDVVEVWRTVRLELEIYGSQIAKMSEVIVLTKADLTDGQALEKKILQAKTVNEHVLAASVLDEESLKRLSDELVRLLRNNL